MNRIDAGRNIAPLIGAANLKLDVVVREEMLKVDRLQYLVGKFRKGNARFQTACDNFLRQHRIDAEQLAVIAEEVQQINFAQPVVVIHERNIRAFAEQMNELGF